MKFLLLLIFPVFGFGQIKADQKISILDDKVEMLVPKELSKMSDEAWKIKYQDFPRPKLALIDESGEITLLVDHTKQALADTQMTAYKDFRLNMLRKSKTYIKILGDGVRTINGKRIGFIKFSSQPTDQNIFNYYAFAVVDGKILSISFNCREKLQKTWEQVADEMVDSLKIK